jgi:hypothetical protein
MDQERPGYITDKYCLTRDESIVLKFAARTHPTCTSKHELYILIIIARLKVT